MRLQRRTEELKALEQLADVDLLAPQLLLAGALKSCIERALQDQRQHAVDHHHDDRHQDEISEVALDQLPSLADPFRRLRPLARNSEEGRGRRGNLAATGPAGFDALRSAATGAELRARPNLRSAVLT